MQLNQIDSSISQISEDQLNDLFADTPKGTPNADTIVGGKKPENKDDKDDKSPIVAIKDDGGIPQIDMADFDEDDEDTQNVDKDKIAAEAKKKADAEAKAKADAAKNDDTTDDEAKKKAEADKKAKKPETKVDKAEVSSILKNTVDYLIEQGVWQDFDGREDLTDEDYTEDTYAQLAAKQDENRLNAKFSELLDSTGPYGKAIIDFVSQGGNPDQIIDLFKEQQRVEAIDTKSEAGQKAIIERYYEDVMGWNKAKVQKYINTLVGSNGLEEEANDTKELFDSFYEDQLQEVNQKQEQYRQEQARREQDFSKNITTALTSRSDLNEKEKRVIKDSILKYDKKLPDGSLVNDFYLEFAKMQADPSAYIDLVMFVTDNANYKKRIQKTADSTGAQKAFKFIKGNTALNAKRGTSHDRTERTSDDSTFNWGLGK